MPRGTSLRDEMLLQRRLWSPVLLRPALWLDAADLSTISISTGGVEQWRDKSGNARNATQATPLRRLTYDATGFNGLPCLSAAEANVMVLPTLPLTSAGVVFFGFSLNNDTGYGVVATNDHWDRFIDGKSYPALLRTARIEQLALSMPTTGKHIMCYIANPASEYTIRRNGTQIYSGGPFTFSNNITGLGTGNNVVNAGAGGSAINGSIVEIAVVPGIMSAAEIQRVEGYLANKWRMRDQLPANHPYRNNPPLIGA